MSLVELTDGQSEAFSTDSSSIADADALWLSTSSVDLSALWGRECETRSQECASGLAGLAFRDYWPIAPLARGSHGEVWKAVRVAPSLELVALKVLRFDQAHRADRR